ncbi:MAG: TRAP transporter large permease subunit, partial [Alphaproteobacteria bacterium]
MSIASATVFSRIAVPEMLRFDYNKRFAVGTVAGSSVLGMLIPPSILLIIYALIAEESVGDMFIAGVGPGLLLTVAYCVMILFMAYVFPSKVMNPAAVARLSDPLPDAGDDMSFGQVVAKLLPIVMLVIVVLGGIYAGLYTPTEAGAAGAFVAFLFALGRRALTPKRMWDILVETGHITATLLLLIIAASMYSRMLGISGLPTQLGNWINGLDASLALLLFIYVVIVLILGTIIDSVSIMLITVPLFLTVLAPFNVDLVWFGIVTIIAVEIGLLTPPLGLAVYVIKSTLQNEDFTLADIFIGAAPYAVTMLIVLIITIVFPDISLY